MQTDDRLLRVLGGPLDGATVGQSRADAQGRWFQKVMREGSPVRIAVYEYDAGTDALHFVDLATVRNGSAAT